MKKTKFIPYIIILVLGIAVITLGIYAVNPTANTITGTATITSTNAPVEIEITNVVDGQETQVSSGEITNGNSLTLSYGTLLFDSLPASNVYEIPMQEIRVKITNKSSVDLGAYFCTDEVVTTPPTEADVDDMVYGHITHNTYFDYEYAFYNHLPKKDGETEIQITMSVYVRVKELPEEDIDEAIPIYLAIEMYQPNYTENDGGFIKVGTDDIIDRDVTIEVPDGEYYQASEQSFEDCMPLNWAENVTHIVLPYGTKNVTGYYNTQEAMNYSYFSYYSEQLQDFASNLVAITIPKSVTNINYCAFCRVKTLESIILPEGIEGINGDYAFCLCTGLTTMVIPASVSSIGRVFDNCTELVCVEFKNGTSNLQLFSTFCSCTKLKRVKLPDNLKVLSTACFSGCSALETINLPEGLTEIGLQCFRNCTALGKITIPESVTSVGYYCFVGCTNLSRVTFINNNENTWYLRNTPTGANEGYIDVKNSTTNATNLKDSSIWGGKYLSRV